MPIEDMIFEPYLPVNTLALLNRMQEIVKEGRTNSLFTFTHRNDPDLQLKMRKAFWLLAKMMLHVIPLDEKSWDLLCSFVNHEWDRLYRLEEQRKAHEEAIKLLAYL